MKKQVVGKAQTQVSIVDFGGGVYSATISRKGEIRKLKECSWGQVRGVLDQIKPASLQVMLGDAMIGFNAQAVNQFASGVSNAAQVTGCAAPHRETSTATQEQRLECIRLAIQAGVPADKVIDWASNLSAWLKDRDR